MMIIYLYTIIVGFLCTTAKMWVISFECTETRFLSTCSGENQTFKILLCDMSLNGNFKEIFTVCAGRGEKKVQPRETLPC